MFLYQIYFSNGAKLELKLANELDLHLLRGNALIFDDIYINLQNVNLIQKMIKGGTTKVFEIVEIMAGN